MTRPMKRTELVFEGEVAAILRPVPKPAKSEPKARRRLRPRNKKRQGSSFPTQRNPAHCRFVIEETPCVGLGLVFTHAVSPNDNARATQYRGLLHVCWGDHDPAHVGKHRAQGAPDLGHVVNMCRALHDFYDQHRDVFAKVTGLTERKLALIASGNGLRWVERGGAP